MTTVPVSPNQGAAIVPNRFARNNLIASVQAQSEMAAGFNYAWRYRCRELFVLGGRLTSIQASAGAGGAEQMRGYSWVSPNALKAHYSVMIAKPSSAAVADPYVQIDLYDSGGSLIGSAQAHYGSATGAPNDTPDEFQEHTGTIDGIDSIAGSGISCVVTSFNNARFIGATIWEETTAPDTARGYQLAVTNTQSILTGQRGLVSGLLKDLVDNGGGTQICLPDVLFSTASATQKNILDQTSTTVSVNTPGMTLDLRYKGRKSKTTVPVHVAVWGACSAGSNGSFKVYDSSGAVVLTMGPFSTVAGWLLSVFNAPTTQAKYDLMLSTAASITTIQYVSIFEQGT